jgi:hypothetical protein
MNQLHPIMQAALAPFTQHLPAFNADQISQERWLAADLANNVNKTEQRDAAAMDQQIKFQGVGDGLR